MRAFLRFLQTFLLSCAVAQAAGVHPSLPAIGSLDGLGVNIHFTDPQPGELEMIKAAGFKWVRTDFAWAGTEREAGRYDFAAYDRLAAALQKNGLRAVFILDYGNPLYDDGLAPHTDAGRAAFAKWAAAALGHFQGRGFLWELWNEPNIAQFWKPQPDVQQYIALAKAVAMEIRNPNSEIRNEAFIGPACSTIDLPFLEACMQAGLLEFFDGVSVHPYRQTAPETVEEEYRSVRLLIRKYAPAGKTIPVLSGEWGYSDAWGCGGQGAEMITEQFLTNIANDVPLSIWYDWRDDGLDPKDPEHHFGIVAHESVKDEKLPFKPKDAYKGVKLLIEQLRGYHFSKRLVVENENGQDEPTAYVLLFNRGKLEQKLVVWSASTESWEKIRYVLVPASHGLFRMCTSRSVMHSRLAAGDDGILINPSDWGVKYLTPEKPNDFLRLAAASLRAPLEFVYHWPGEELLPPDTNSNPPDSKDDNVTSISSFGDMPGGLSEGLTNPLSRTLTLIFGFSSPNYKLRAGEQFPMISGVESSSRQARSAEEVEVCTAIDMGNGQTLHLQQETMLVCTNALDLEVYPPNQEFLPVRLFNPSGEAFLGHIEFEHAPPPSGSHSFYARATVSLAMGEREKVVKIPIDPAKPPAGELFFEIRQDYRTAHSSAHNAKVFSKSFPAFVALPPLGAAALHHSADGDEKTVAEHTLSDETPPDGPSLSSTAALKMVYRFSGGWKFLRLSAEKTDIQRLTTRAEGWRDWWPKGFALWLHGDGKGCAARIRFVDATGQTFQADGPKIDWTGWRYVSFPMLSPEDKPLAHWGGANDGAIHYPIKWDTIFLLDNVSREPVEGEVYLSAPTLIY